MRSVWSLYVRADLFLRVDRASERVVARDGTAMSICNECEIIRIGYVPIMRIAVRRMDAAIKPPPMAGVVSRSLGMPIRDVRARNAM